jgi:hypothetical protein
MRFTGGKRICIEVCVDFIPRSSGDRVLGGHMTSSGGIWWRVASRGLRIHPLDDFSSRVFSSRSSR